MQQPTYAAQRATLRSLSDSALNRQAAESWKQTASHLPAPEGIKDTANDGYSRCRAEILSNVQPYRRASHSCISASLSSAQARAPKSSQDGGGATACLRESTTVLQHKRQDPRTIPATQPDTVRPDSAQQRAADGVACSAPGPIPWSVLAVSSAQRSLRIAQQIKYAPWDALKAARSAFVPFGNQVWLPNTQLGSLATTVGLNGGDTSAFNDSQPKESGRSILVSAVDAARSSAQQRSMLCPASHRVPSYRQSPDAHVSRYARHSGTCPAR